jgi:hypothetical protein
MGKKWSKEEDEVIKKFYPKIRFGRDATWQKVLAKLPGRTRVSCRARARKLSAATRPHWTEAEDVALEKLWADTSTRAIMKAIPGRTWKAICMHAKDIGLEGRWQGYVTVAEAAKRMGYHHAAMTRLVEMSNIGVFTRVSRSDGSKFKHRMVEWDSILEFVTNHLKLETPAQTSARTGIPTFTLNKWIAAAGLSPGRRGVQARMPREQMDALIAQHREEWLKRRYASREARLKRKQENVTPWRKRRQK